MTTTNRTAARKAANTAAIAGTSRGAEWDAAVAAGLVVNTRYGHVICRTIAERDEELAASEFASIRTA